jgi:hypothetical protein
VRRGFQTFLWVLGGVMVVAGAAGVVLGARTVLDPGSFSANVDSETRFFAVWYAAAGVLVIYAARDVASSTTLIRVVAGAFFVAGLARLLSWATVGRPHWTQLALMVIELVLPAVIVGWHAAAARDE